MTKVATNTKLISTKEYARNEVFLQHIYDGTDDVVLQRNMWIISYQQEKFPMLWYSAVPAGTKLNNNG